MSDRFTRQPPRLVTDKAYVIAILDRSRIAESGKRIDRKAKETGLPGQRNGPQDLYRHAMFAGTLTLEYGPETANALLELNERKRYFDVVPWGAKSDVDTLMDRTVNPMAVEAMRAAKTPEDVDRIVRQLTLDAIRNNGTGANGSIPYLPEHEWHPRHREDGGDPHAIPPEWRPLGDPRGEMGINPRLADMALDVPFEMWTEAHVRAVMQDRRYYRDHPERKARSALVSRWFERKYDGGPVHVAAHARGDGTQVAAHTRSSPRA